MTYWQIMNGDKKTEDEFPVSSYWDRLKNTAIGTRGTYEPVSSITPASELAQFRANNPHTLQQPVTPTFFQGRGTTQNTLPAARSTTSTSNVQQSVTTPNAVPGVTPRTSTVQQPVTPSLFQGRGARSEQTASAQNGTYPVGQQANVGPDLPGLAVSGANAAASGIRNGASAIVSRLQEESALRRYRDAAEGIQTALGEKRGQRVTKPVNISGATVNAPQNASAKWKNYLATMTGSEIKHFETISDPVEKGRYITELDLESRVRENYNAKLAQQARVLENNVSRLAEKSDSAEGHEIADFVIYGRGAAWRGEASYVPPEYQLLTDKQKATIKAYADAGDYENVANYYHAIERTLTAQQAERETEQAKNFSSKNAVTAALSAPIAGLGNAFGGIPALAETTMANLRDAFTGEYIPVDYNSAAFSIPRRTSALSQGAKEYINDRTEGNANWWANTLWDAVSSGTSNLIQMYSGQALGLSGKALEQFTLVSMSTSAAGQASYEALQNGQDNFQALVNSAANGMIEYATETLPIHMWTDTMGKLKRGQFAQAAKDLWRSMAAQTLAEGWEEVVGNVADQTFDIAFNGSNSAYNQRVNELLSVIQRDNGTVSNADVDRAKEQAFVELYWDQSIQAAASAALSVLLMDGVPAAANRFTYNSAGKNIRASGAVSNGQNSAIENEIQKGLQFEPDSMAYKQAARMQESISAGKDVPNREIGRLAYLNADAAGNLINMIMESGSDAAIQQAAEILDGAQGNIADKLTVDNLRTLYSLYRTGSVDTSISFDAGESAVSAAQSADNTRAENPRAVVVDAATQLWLDTGMNLKNARRNAMIGNRLMQGQAVTDRQIDTLNLTSRQNQAVFSQLYGVTFPEKITQQQTYEIARSAAVRPVENPIPAPIETTLIEPASEPAVESAPVNSLTTQAVSELPQNPPQATQEHVSAPQTYTDTTQNQNASETIPDAATTPVENPFWNDFLSAMGEIGPDGKRLISFNDFAQQYRTSVPDADNAQISAAYSEYLNQKQTVSQNGKHVSRDDFFAAQRENNPAITREQSDRMFSEALQRQMTAFLEDGQRVPSDMFSNDELESMPFGSEIGMDAETNLYKINPEQHIDKRTLDNVKTRSMKAFQFYHPELHPYYVAAAQYLADELDNAQRGGTPVSGSNEKTGGKFTYYAPRQATERINYLLDDGKLSYKQITDAIDAVINDKGAENNAAGKRVEIVLDDMLSNGFESIHDGRIPPNQKYIELKSQIPGADVRDAQGSTATTGNAESAPSVQSPEQAAQEYNESIGTAPQEKQNESVQSAEAESQQAVEMAETPEAKNTRKKSSQPTPKRGKSAQRDFIELVRKMTNVDLTPAQDTQFDNRRGFNIDTRNLDRNDLAAVRSFVENGYASGGGFDVTIQDNGANRLFFDVQRSSAPSEMRVENPSVTENVPETQADFPQGTGAAEAGFAGPDLYEENLQRYGALPGGETPTNPDSFLRENNEVPSQVTLEDGGEVPTSRAARTIYESNAFPHQPIYDSDGNAVIREYAFRDLVVNGDLGYIPYSDEAAKRDAEETFQRDGWEKTLRDWTAAVRSGQVSKELDAIGAYLLNNAANNPDATAEEVMDIIYDYVSAAHTAAQALQGQRILKQLTPQGILYMRVKDTEKINREQAKNARKKSNVKDRNAEKEAESVIEQQRNDALNLIREIHDVFAEPVRKKHGIPVSEWMTEVGNRIANQLSQRLNEPKPKSITRIIQEDLLKFAENYRLPERKTSPPRTASMRLKDYFDNRENYARAWNQARDALREKYKDDPAMLEAFEEFIHGTIGYNAAGADAVMLRAVADAALESDPNVQKLASMPGRVAAQAQAGNRDITEKRIYTMLARRIEPSESDAIILRDAVHRYVQESIEANPDALDQRIKQSLREIGVRMSDIIKKGSHDKTEVARSITRMLAQDFNIPEDVAEQTGEIVVDKFNQIVAERSEKELERIFREKKTPVRVADKVLKQFRELAAMGAFTSPNYREQAAAKIFGYENISIDPQLIQEYLDVKPGDTEKLNEAENKLIQNIADQLQASGLEKLDAARYLAMLGNFRTVIRNTGGNAAMQVVSEIKNVVGTGLEAVLYNAGVLERRERNITFRTADFTAAFNDFYENNNAIRNIIMQGGSYSEGDQNAFMREVLNRRQIFGRENSFQRSGNAVARTAGNVIQGIGTAAEYGRKTSDWLMNNNFFGDAAFASVTYARTLARYLKANGLTFENASAAQLNAGREIAIREAAEATYRDNNAFANMIKSIGFRNLLSGVKTENLGPYDIAKKELPKNVANLALGGIQPFRKTPANILARAVEYSPVSLLGTAIDAAAKAKGSSTISGNDIVNQLAKGLTGTGLAILGALLFSHGLLTGAGPDDDREREFMELQGWQQYSFVYPGLDGNTKYYSIDWLAPASITLFLGANFAEIMRQDAGERTLYDYVSVFTSLADPVFKMSMMQGIEDFFENSAIYGNDTYAVVRAVSNALWGLMTQFVPTIAGQAERSANNTRQQTYVDSNLQEPRWLQYALGKVSSKIPGWDYNQIDYIDAWGRTQDNNETEIGNFFAQFFSPGYKKVTITSDMERELNRLYQASGDSEVLPKRAQTTFNVVETVDDEGNPAAKTGKKLTAAEYITYATVRGQTAHEIMEAVMSDPAYAGLNDFERGKLVKNVFKFSQEIGQSYASGNDPATWSEDSKTPIGSPEITGWVKRAVIAMRDDDLPVYTSIIAYTRASQINSLTDAKGKAIDNSKGLQVANMVREMGLTPEQSQKLLGMLEVGKEVQSMYRPKANDYSGQWISIMNHLNIARTRAGLSKIENWRNS